MTEPSTAAAPRTSFVPSAGRGWAALAVGIVLVLSSPLTLGIIHSLIGSPFLLTCNQYRDPFLSCGAGFTVLWVFPAVAIATLVSWTIGVVAYKRLRERQSAEAWGRFGLTAVLGLVITVIPLGIAVFVSPPLESADWLRAIPVVLLTVLSVGLCVAGALRPASRVAVPLLIAGAAVAAIAIVLGSGHFVGQLWTITVAVAAILARTAARPR